MESISAAADSESSIVKAVEVAWVSPAEHAAIQQATAATKKREEDPEGSRLSMGRPLLA